MSNPTSPSVREAMLSSEQYYRQALAGLEEPTHEQEQALLQRVRQGDLLARDQLVTTVFLSYVHYWACRLLRYCRSHRLEYLDLIQVGNLTVVERLAEALDKENPIGWLRAMARYAMLAYCARYSSLVVTPLTHWKQPLAVDSLDVAIQAEEGVWYADVLASPATCETGEDHASAFPQLYEALELLSNEQREVIYQYYGLGDQPRISTLRAVQTSTEDGTSMSTGYAMTAHRKILRRLRTILQAPTQMQQAYSAAQASRLLHVDPTVLCHYASQGLLSRLATGYYRKQEVDQLLRQRQEQWEEDSYTATQVSERLGVSLKNLGRYVKRGVLRKVGHGLYAKQEVDQLAGQQQKQREEDSYTAIQASGRLGISRRSFYRYVEQGMVRQVGPGLYARPEVDCLARQRHSMPLCEDQPCQAVGSA